MTYLQLVNAVMRRLRESEVTSVSQNTYSALIGELVNQSKRYIENAVNSVNEAQLTASDMRDAYERGEDIPLTDVVLAMQKSSLAFEATLQVRNKLLKAYEDIKNMPV